MSVNSSESHGSSHEAVYKPVPTIRTKRGDQSTIASMSAVNTSLVNTSLVNASVMSSQSSSGSRRTDSSSTGYSDGEVDNCEVTATTTGGAVVQQSAPPVFSTTVVTTTSFPSPREIKYHPDVSLTYASIEGRRKTEPPTSYADYHAIPPPPNTKTTITRSPNVAHYKDYKTISESLLEHAKLERLNEASNYNVKLDEPQRSYRRAESVVESPRKTQQQQQQQNFNYEKEMNFLRRQNSEGDTRNYVVKMEEQQPAAAVEVTVLREKRDKNEPDVPVRSARRNRPSREVQCRSMGENIVDVNTSER